MVLLELQQLRCGYGMREILREINLKIEQGEFVGIIGPNGSGKTTLLRTISRVLEPTRGKVIFRGRDLYHLRSRQVAREIAVVPQDTLISFPFTVEEVVLLGRLPHLGRFRWESSHDRAVVFNAMALTDTLELAERPVNELSGGERQRVIIAQALAQEPRILLLDEPTTHLDINHQIEILELLKKLNFEQKLTIILISHDLNFAAQYCQHLVMLKEGSIFMEGGPSQVLTPENIKKVYQTPVMVINNPVTGFPCIVPISEAMSRPYSRKEKKVHLICGGGSGSHLLRRLFLEGYEITAGVLNLGDTDQRLAESLGLKVVVEAPFSSIQQERLAENKRLAESSDAVILTNIPFGWGNFSNLETAFWAHQKGIPVLVVDEVPLESRDYTGGKATSLYRQLLQEGAVVTREEDEVIEALSRIFSFSHSVRPQ